MNSIAVSSQVPVFVWTNVFKSLGQTPRSGVAGPLVSLTGRFGSKGGAGSLASEAQWGMTEEAVVTLGPSGQKRVGPEWWLSPVGDGQCNLGTDMKCDLVLWV